MELRSNDYIYNSYMYYFGYSHNAMVLLQQGKGSDLGSAFGGGSSNSMFGALGPSNFFWEITYILVAIWLILSMTLAYLLKQENPENAIDSEIIEEVNKEDS